MFPYIVIRHAPTIYTRRPVPIEGELGPDQREAVCRQVEHIVARSGARACAVFGPGDAVYVEPGGRRWSPPPGSAVPDGYAYIRLPGADQRESVATWRSSFRVWDRAAGIWSVDPDRADVVQNALRERGIERHVSFGGSPGGGGGTDVGAFAFLDGGLHDAWPDGFVSGELRGTKVVGELAFLWCCHLLSVPAPRTCPAVDLDRLDQAVVPTPGDAAAGELLKRARTADELLAAARELSDRWERSAADG